MVICPPTIVINWSKEFKKWTPADCKESLGSIFCVNDVTLERRIAAVRAWYLSGGVLISISPDIIADQTVGYSQFRTLLLKVNDEEHKKTLREALVDPGPELVIADEAHIISNKNSKISRLIGEINTFSRIATTGSPLSNHLEEYWAMMNWIHPGFLGTLRSFAGSYIEPIKDGLYANSTVAQKRTSQTRLLKLKRMLDDKLHRKDLSVIQADLPSKTEFVIYVPLAPLQRKLYEGAINGGAWKGYQSLFKWINILRLICNHPYTLMVASKASWSKCRYTSKNAMQGSKRSGTYSQESLRKPPAEKSLQNFSKHPVVHVPPIQRISQNWLTFSLQRIFLLNSRKNDQSN